MRNLVVITLDSCRYVSWIAAQPQALPRLGEVERGFSFATCLAQNVCPVQHPKVTEVPFVEGLAP